MSIVVFDLETQSTIQQSFGSDRTTKTKNLQISVACALVLDAELVVAGKAKQAMDSAREFTFWREQCNMEGLLALFDSAEVIAAYNSLGFDSLVLMKHYGASAEGRRRYMSHVVKTLDIFARLRDATRVWYKLDDLLKSNSIPTKTANGLEAIAMFADGRLEDLERYCQEDVRSLAKLLLCETLTLPNVPIQIPNHLFGLRSLVAASRLK